MLIILWGQIWEIENNEQEIFKVVRPSNKYLRPLYFLIDELTYMELKYALTQIVDLSKAIS